MHFLVLKRERNVETEKTNFFRLAQREVEKKNEKRK